MKRAVAFIGATAVWFTLWAVQPAPAIDLPPSFRDCSGMSLPRVSGLGLNGPDTVFVINNESLCWNGRDGDDSASGSASDCCNIEDRLWGQNHNDDLFGWNGNDYLGGGNGGDLLVGDDGKDRLEGNGGGDDIYGDPGDDFIWDGEGADRVVGGAGYDIWLRCDDSTNEEYVAGIESIHSTTSANCNP